MKVSELLNGRDEFESKTAIIELIKNSKNFDPRMEDPQKADALLIFSTSKQHTWLVASSERLYCILDDVRKERPHINWSMPRAQLVSGGEVTVNIKSRPHMEYSGLVDVGDAHRNWLYTKRLFSDAPIEQRIRELIENNMVAVDGPAKI